MNSFQRLTEKVFRRRRITRSLSGENLRCSRLNQLPGTDISAFPSLQYKFHPLAKSHWLVLDETDSACLVFVYSVAPNEKGLCD